MSTVKKKSIIKNMFFSAKNRAKMQKYLNTMSQNGYHLKSIGKFGCTFTDDETVRNIYSICPEGDTVFYQNDKDWQTVTVRKGAKILKKEIPDNAVSLTRSFGKNQLQTEAAWLGSLLLKGLVLTGKTGSEYIFMRSQEFTEYRYIIVDERDYAPSDKLKFLALDEQGKVYLIKNASIENRIRKMRGKNLPDLMLSFFMALGGACCLAVSLIFFGFKAASLLSSGQNALPFIIAGSALAVISLTVMLVGYFRFRRISELRKIMKEERLALQRQQAEKKGEKTPPPPENKAETKNNNTVVMNTVVMNNYGKRKKGSRTQDFEQPVQDDEFDAALDNIFEGNYAPVNQTDNPALDEESNPALMYWKDPKDMTKKLIKAYSGEKKSKSASAGMANRDNVFYVDNDDTAEKPDNTGKSSVISNEESNDFYVRENTGNGKTAIIVKSLLILLSVVIFSFSLRYVISFFARGAESGYLLLIPALIGIAVTVIATVYLTKSLILDLQERSVNSDENDIYGEDDGER